MFAALKAAAFQNSNFSRKFDFPQFEVLSSFWRYEPKLLPISRSL